VIETKCFVQYHIGILLENMAKWTNNTATEVTVLDIAISRTLDGAHEYWKATIYYKGDTNDRS